MKTVFLTSFHPFIPRNILDSGVLDLLSKECRIILFCPKNQEGYYRQKYSDRSIVQPIDSEEVINSKKNKIFRSLAELLLNTKAQKFHQMIYASTKGSRLSYYFKRLFTELFARSHLVWWIYRFLDYNFNNPLFFKNYFNKYGPDVVFVTDIFGEVDVLMLKNAKFFGVRSVGMVRSWDNTTTKHLLRVFPNLIIVANEIMKDELKRFHGYDNLVRYCGFPQFEPYLRFRPISRNKFAEKFRLEKGKKIVLFFPAGDKFIDTDPQICEILLQAQKKGEISQNVQFLVSLHPHNTLHPERFSEGYNLRIVQLGIKLSGKPKDIVFSKNDVEALGNMIYHSDVIINVLSSTLLDAACFGKPVITIGFNGLEKNVKFVRSVEIYHKQEAIENLLNLGYTPIAKNRNEFVALINKYLQNPQLDRDKRSKFLSRVFWKFDGKAADRIALSVLEGL